MLGPPPEFARITAVGPNELTIELMKVAPAQKTGTRIVDLGGQKVTETYVIHYLSLVPQTETWLKKNHRLLTVGGKDADWSKASGTMILRAHSPDGIDAGYKKLLAKDALVLVPTK
jgi:hypothetical protein